MALEFRAQTTAKLPNLLKRPNILAHKCHEEAKYFAHLRHKISVCLAWQKCHGSPYWVYSMCYRYTVSAPPTQGLLFSLYRLEQTITLAVSQDSSNYMRARDSGEQKKWGWKHFEHMQKGQMVTMSGGWDCECFFATSPPPTRTDMFNELLHE